GSGGMYSPIPPPGQRLPQNSRCGICPRLRRKTPPLHLPGPGHQRPNRADDDDLCEYVRRPRPQQVQERTIDGFPVEKAVVTSRDCVEDEGERPPRQGCRNREAVTAPIGPQAAAPGQINGSPYDQ